ncbi:MAG: ferrous iron transport protein B [Asgard group archaeon]|nr:ferrous iron transport protein B [Asgard group archaeon]
MQNDHIIEHKIVFLGNPNVGKSSLFNLLTGSHQHVGNWPGKTIEKKEGHFILSDEFFSLIDLPGTYSLSARSDEEIVTRKFITEEEPDLVCIISDATRLERTLFLALQTMELTKKIAIFINMTDLAEKIGLYIDNKKLEEQLGVPVLLVSATDDNSVIRIKKFLYDAIHTDKYEFNPAMLLYSTKIELMIQSISRQIEYRSICTEYPTRWLAVKILEGDESVIETLEAEYDLTNVFDKINKLAKSEKLDLNVELSKSKYSILHKIVASSVTGFKDFQESRSDKVDKIILNKFWSYPILIVIYAAFFLITFYASSPIINGIDLGISQFSFIVENWLININSPAILTSLIVNGIIAGIAAVLLFIPIIVIFYSLIAIMEDSGYLARSAFIMDRVMSKFGLQGTAFLSMVMGFGCNVAGIMATRTIKNEKDRISMIITNSFLPCAARLGVIAFLTGIFFEPWLAALLMLTLYGFSIFLVLASSLLFGLFFKKNDPLPLIMELPEYRRPRLRNIYYLTWTRAGIFIKKAGTFIFIASLFIWLMSSIPFGAPPERTIAGYLGRGISYVTEPLLGLDWKMVIPLLFGIPAKEAIISALGILYSTGGSIIEVLKASWSIPQAISFLLFQLTYAPCFAALAAIRSETKSWKLTALGFYYPIIVTIIFTTIVFQILNFVM